MSIKIQNSMVIDEGEMISIGVLGLSEADFVKLAKEIAELSDVAEVEMVENPEDMEGKSVILWHRDAGNYKYPFALKRTSDGDVWVQEPTWYGDEDDDKELFWDILRDKFNFIHEI